MSKEEDIISSDTDCQSCKTKKCLINQFIRHAENADIQNYKQSSLFPKGNALIKQGQKGNGIYFLKSGKVKVTKKNSGTQEQILYLASNGTSFGGRDLLNRSSYSYSVYALEDTEACFIPSNKFLEIHHASSYISEKIREELSQLQINTEEKLIRLSLMPVRQRFALLLHDLIENFGKKDKKEISIEVPLSREELANLTGSTVEGVVRLIADFRKLKIVRTDVKKILIADLEGLKREAGLPVE